MTLVIDLREVEAVRAANTILDAKGIVAGASVEQATGADGVRVARVRIRLTQPAAHQVRSKRNVIYVDLDSAFPLGSVGAAAPASVPAPARRAFATVLETVRAEAKPTGASITLTATASSSPNRSRRSAMARRAWSWTFPTCARKAPADVFVGRGPVSVVHVTTTVSCRRRGSSWTCCARRAIA